MKYTFVHFELGDVQDVVTIYCSRVSKPAHLIERVGKDNATAICAGVINDLRRGNRDGLFKVADQCVLWHAVTRDEASALASQLVLV